MDRDSIAAALDADHEVEAVEKGRKRTLGNVRLRHHETNELILIPTPSSDPNDPLNWYVSGFHSSLRPLLTLNRSQWYKYYMAAG